MHNPVLHTIVLNSYLSHQLVNSNAIQIAEYLEKHSKIKKVIYPGLQSHPQHKLALSQMSGFSGIISFEVSGGMAEVKTFLQNLKIFSLAESLGGVESLIEVPSVMTHASLLREERKKIEISDTLIRLSVGIEDTVDLLDDLNQTLGKLR